MLHTNKWMYRHTDAQTDANERFTPATVVGVSNEQKYVVPNPPTNYKYSQCRQNVGIWPTNYFQPTLMPQIKSNQISRFAKAPHHQSTGVPNIMTSNRDKTNILNKSKNKKEKKN